MNFLLADINDKLQLNSSNAVNLDIHVSFTDLASGAATPGKQNTAMTTATTADILASPAASTARTVKGINIRNKSGTATIVTLLYDDNGTDYELFSTTLAGGEHLTYTEGLGWYRYVDTAPVDLWRFVNSGLTGQNVATAQPWIPTNGALSVNAGEMYRFDGYLRTSRSAGTTSHTTNLLFGGTATLTAITYTVWVNVGDVVNTLVATEVSITVETAASTNVKAASTSATEQMRAVVQGAVVFNAAGTFIPQFIYSVAPGGAPTIMAGSYFRMTKVNAAIIGAWS